VSKVSEVLLLTPQSDFCHQNKARMITHAIWIGGDLKAKLAAGFTAFRIQFLLGH